MKQTLLPTLPVTFASYHWRHSLCCRYCTQPLIIEGRKSQQRKLLTVTTRQYRCIPAQCSCCVVMALPKMYIIHPHFHDWPSMKYILSHIIFILVDIEYWHLINLSHSICMMSSVESQKCAKSTQRCYKNNDYAFVWRRLSYRAELGKNTGKTRVKRCDVIRMSSHVKDKLLK